MADELIEVKVTGNADDYTRAMADAANAANRFDRANKTAVAGGTKLGGASRGAKDEVNKLTEGLEGLKRTLQGVGGRLGESGEKTSALAEGIGKLSSAAGPAGLALGGLVAGAVAFAAAGFSAAASARETLDELEKLNRTPVLDQEEVDNIEDADEALAELSASFSELSVTLGALFAPALTDIASGLDTVVDSATFVIGKLETLKQVVTFLASAGTSELLGYTNAFEALSDEIRELAGLPPRTVPEIERLSAAIGEIGEQDPGNVLEPIRKVEDVSKAAADAARDAAKEARELAAQQRQAESATANLFSFIEDGILAQLDGEDLVLARLELKKERIQELADASGDAALAAVATQQAEQAAEDEIAEIRAQRHQDEMQALSERLDAERAMHFELLAAEEERRALTIAASQDIAGNISASASAISGLLAHGAAEQKNFARAAFQVSKAAAIVQNVIYGANAFTAALDDAPVPFNFVLAGSVAAAAAAQTAVIAAQSPNFHIGSRAGLDQDERIWRVTASETPAVLTAQGRQTAGEISADLNAAASDGPAPMLLVMGHQAVDLAGSRALRSPNSAMMAAIAAGEPRGHSRGRR